mmetsp:Transcript_34102/g.71806  ORF Transcript_34102/g.71806 Transcript_34102/m.71806 type:complete len:661 (+) Transcript_34102:248-2230(+)
MILPALLILSQLDVINSVKPVFPFSSVSFPEGNAYTKYEKYPPGCSTPDEMEKRAVPPLQENSNGVSSQLIHVTTIIRHGARTPYAGAPEYQCWDGYWEDEETGIWNCDLKTYISPPAATKDHVVDSEGMLQEEPDFLFEKRYDALTGPSGKTENHLNGTCQLGQLLQRGYDQELQNGFHLRQAYFYDGKTAEEHTASDSRMRLWDLTKESEGGRKASTPDIGDPTKQLYQEPNLRYRADDEQRTLMSGQVLLRGLFEQELSSGDDETAIIRLHTADYALDVLVPDEKICPKTLQMKNEAYNSDEYNHWIDNSMEVKMVKSFLKEDMGLDEVPSSILDCLMTTICTDRSLPDSLNDYDGSLGTTPWEDFLPSSSTSAEGVESGDDATAMFERVANFAIKNFTFPYKYNDAAFAKQGMGPLWKEIMANILPIVDSANYPSSGTPLPKLALFSGHDTTLMPLLATLGDKVWSGTDWPPYASMIQIEIHEITNSNEGSDFPSGYAFRLVYNGLVLTERMDGCVADSELCDSQVLVNQVMTFAKYQERDCEAASVVPPYVKPYEDGLAKEMKTALEELVAAPGGVWVVVVFAMFCISLGAMLTFFSMKRQMPKSYCYRPDSLTLGGFSMTDMEDDETRFQSENSPVTESGETSLQTKFDENTLI